MKVTAVRLFRVEGQGPAWTFEDRAVEALDLYADHVRATAGAGDAPAHLTAWYVTIDDRRRPIGPVRTDRPPPGLPDRDGAPPAPLGADPLATAGAARSDAARCTGTAAPDCSSTR